MTSDFLSCAIFAVLVARRGHRFRPRLDFTGTREMVRFSGGMYLAGIVGALPQLLLPLIVFARVGAHNAAYWGIAMSIAAMLFQLPGMISQALLPEATHRPTERRQLIGRSALLVAGIVTPALVIVYCFATVGLSVFGKSYVAGSAGPLRWLVIAAFITMLNSMAGTILVLAKKSLMITVVNVVNAVVVLGMVLTWATSVDEIAISWVVGDVFNTTLFFFAAFLALREVGWRWADLGGPQVEAAIRPYPFAHAATGGLQGLALLAEIAERQQEVRQYLPRHYPLTSSRELFTVAALQAAERVRADSLRKPVVPQDRARSAPQTRRQSAPTDPQHVRAFGVLFQMADRQREAGLMEPSHPESLGRYPYPEE